MNPLEKKDSKIASFIFKAQLAQSEINKILDKPTENHGVTFESVSKKVSLDHLDKDLVADAKKMSAVYIAIATFENMLREIVSEKLLEEKGESWWQSDVISSDIRKRAEKKKTDGNQHRWHAQRGVNLLNFTELKDLVSIICKDSNWLIFEDLFGNADWVRHTVKSLERSRNVIMHSGQLSLEDIERVGLIIRDCVRQLGG